MSKKYAPFFGTERCYIQIPSVSILITVKAIMIDLLD